MRKLQIAEWILALSMTRERAEAVAGDLSESGRGAFWFWRSVVATMIASVWRDLRSEPWTMAGLSLLAFGFTLALLVIVVFPLERARRAWGILPLPHYSWVFSAVSSVTTVLGMRWAARRAPGREIAVFISVTILSVLLSLLIVLPLSLIGWNIHPSLVGSLESTFLSLLGAISARRWPRLFKGIRLDGVTRA